MARLCALRSQAGRGAAGSGCGHDRIDPGVDDGPVSGCAADGGVGSGTVPEDGTGSGGERSADGAVCGIVAAGGWVGGSTSYREESMKTGMTVEQIVASYDEA